MDAWDSERTTCTPGTIETIRSKGLEMRGARGVSERTWHGDSELQKVMSKQNWPIEVAPTFTVGMMRRSEEARDGVTISSQVTMLLSEGWTVELESGTFWSVFPIGVWQQNGAWVWGRRSLWHHVKPMGTYSVLWTGPCELSRWVTLPGEYSSLSSHTFWNKEYILEHSEKTSAVLELSRCAPWCSNIILLTSVPCFILGSIWYRLDNRPGRAKPRTS